MILSTVNCQLLTVIWDVDPILVHIGDGGIRWYGLLWAIGIYLCYLIQVKIYKNENCPADWTDKLFMWMVIGLIIGARVGHCWFYEWHDVTLPGMKAYCQYMGISTDPVQIFGWTINYRNPYIEHPLRLLKIWEGGLASHGGAIGLLTAPLVDLLLRELLVEDLLVVFKHRLKEVLNRTVEACGGLYRRQSHSHQRDYPQDEHHKQRSTLWSLRDKQHNNQIDEYQQWNNRHAEE